MTTKLKWYGKEVSADIKKKLKKANQLAGEALLTEANKSVPHDDGDLERSGEVETEIDNNEIKTYISYDTPYAVRWHEAPPGSVNFSDPKARTKWLEKTAKEMMDELTKYIKDEMKRM